MTDRHETDDRDADSVVTAPGWFDGAAATFGDRVTGAREALGLEQAELARRMGVKLATVKGWENDRAEPRANKLQMLAGLLGVSIMWLLTGEGDGIEGPETPAETAPDGRGEAVRLLADLRRLRAEQARLAEATGRLEKRLRLALAGRG